MDSGKTTALADCLLLWGSSILFVEKKEGKERGQTNRETGGKTACDSWDPAHPARDPKVETRADGADYAGCGTGRRACAADAGRELLSGGWWKHKQIRCGTISGFTVSEKSGDFSD